jgi:E3 ubiquitin-protein ligase NEDD4
MQINPASGLINEEHLVYFRFLGRIMGKALFDRQLVKGHMVTHLYKHILGWPVTFEDIKTIDQDVYDNMMGLLDLSDDDIENAFLDFTVTESVMGTNTTVDLVENGEDVEVTAENLPEYMEAYMKYKLIGNVQPQLTEILLGFFDVIPEPLMTIFDFQELELLMCGLPTINIEDWKLHTLYTGEFDGTHGDNQWCDWFWEIIENDFDQETRARLLQFVTGTSGVPSGGFAVLQGNDGNIRKFTIHGVKAEICLYPHAHTCFNRIDLPTAATKEELHERLKFSIQMAATGFGIE